jgi:hypothetical protein
MSPKDALLMVLRRGWQQCELLQRNIEDVAQGLKAGTVTEADTLRFAHDTGIIFELFIEWDELEATVAARASHVENPGPAMLPSAEVPR